MKDNEGREAEHELLFSRDNEVIYVWQYWPKEIISASHYHILVARGFTTNQLLYHQLLRHAQPPVITKLLDEAVSLMSADKVHLIEKKKLSQRTATDIHSQAFAIPKVLLGEMAAKQILKLQIDTLAKQFSEVGYTVKSQVAGAYPQSRYTIGFLPPNQTCVYTIGLTLKVPKVGYRRE